MELNLEAVQAVPVLLPEFAKLRLVLVGCGGNGSWMAESLARLAYILQGRGIEVEVEFYDADTVEPKNIPRQRFYPAELGLNKAVALAARYNMRYGLRIAAVPTHFKALERHDWYNTTLTVLVGGVDGPEGRQALHASLAQDKPYRWWLDLGNHQSSGQVLIGSHSDITELPTAFGLQTLCTRLPSPGLLHPELLEPLQRSELEEQSPEGCAHLDVQGLTVNQQVSAIATDYLHRLISGKLTRWATYFDQSTGVMNSLYITPDGIATALNRPRLFSHPPKRKRQWEDD